MARITTPAELLARLRERGPVEYLDGQVICQVDRLDREEAEALKVLHTELERMLADNQRRVVEELHLQPAGRFDIGWGCWLYRSGRIRP